MAHTLRRQTLGCQALRIAAFLLNCSICVYGYFESSNAKWRIICVIGLALFSIFLVLEIPTITE